MSDTFTTLSETSKAVYTEKRSKFLAFAHPIENEAKAKEIVADYKRQYYDARHVCYAYCTGHDPVISHSNDGGEPSGTAGRPILGQITAAGLTNTLVVVVRYFGGVKLGTGPLGVAYRTAAAAAIETAPRITQVLASQLHAATPYADLDNLLRTARKCGAELQGTEYNADNVVATLSIRESKINDLKEAIGKLHTVRLL